MSALHTSQRACTLQQAFQEPKIIQLLGFWLNTACIHSSSLPSIFAEVVLAYETKLMDTIHLPLCFHPWHTALHYPLWERDALSCNA